VAALITPQRLTSYLAATGGDIDRALVLYEWDTHASAALMQTTALVEVIVRNALDRELTAWAAKRGGRSWFDTAPLDQRGRQVLAEARDRATRNGRRPEAHGKVVAELSLGFWRVLTASKYHANLWVPNLHRAFPGADANLRQRRVQVEGVLQQIGNARNRAAHAEPTHRRNLAADLNRAVTIASWVSTHGGAWAATTALLPRVIAERDTLGI
jgi:hypothetical protein